MSHSAASSSWSAIDALLQEPVDQGLLNGAVAMAWQGSELIHASAVGLRDISNGASMQLDAIFRLYSMTKPVTAVAMMILWDEGKWRPEDPITRYLPELEGMKVFRGVDNKGEMSLTAPASPPLMEHLMTHQAGFTYGFGEDAVDQAFRAARMTALPIGISAKQYLTRLATVPLAFDPGSGWRYSISMDLQGIIVERLSGMTLRQFMQSRIFEPLRMTDTDFFVPPDKRDRLATLYTLAGDQLLALPGGPMVVPVDELPVLASGGGGLVSTAADYLRFGRMILNRGTLEGRPVMTDQAVGLMTRSHTPSELLTGQFGTSPHYLRPGYEYAYNGIVVNDPLRAGVSLGRDAYFWDGAAGTWFWVDPENDLVFVVMVNLLVAAERLFCSFAAARSYRESCARSNRK